MINELFGKLYPSLYNVDSSKIKVDIDVVDGNVELNDPKACATCLRLRPNRLACDKVNLRLDTSGVPVKIVDFEKYANQFDNTSAAMKDRCDYIILDGTSGHDKIAFCDLTCSDEKYVNPNKGKYPLGKRAKAFEQMKRSLERLLQEPMLAQYILTFPEKLCLFGWRDHTVADVKPQRGNVVNNMLAFLNTPSAKGGLLTQTMHEVGYGFKFVQVKYPAVYKWN